MYADVSKLVGALRSPQALPVIGWSCPVPFFGHLESSRIGTVGINPSNREFVGADGNELQSDRRLPTLGSLGLTRWADADYRAVRTVIEACTGYFEVNPYSGWFDVLNDLISGTGCSYYAPRSTACHLDIVPWATPQKWGVLGPSARRSLVDAASETLASLIDSSALQMLVLNGREVVRQFAHMAGIAFEAVEVSGWELPRSNGAHVPGIAYTATIDQVGYTSLGRDVRVVGYNHNLQSSFGVTSKVRDAIGQWISLQHANVAS